MTIEELNGKNICILGFGREGKAMLKAIEQEKINCHITVADHNSQLTTHNSQLEWQLGEHWLKDLDRFDVIIKSPGIPPNAILTTHHSQLTNSTQIFLDTATARGATVIGVTGSKGKSTTSSLIHAILQADNHESNPTTYNLPPTTYLVGNIGEPSIAHLSDAQPGTVFVLEMSSYQLMDLTTSPHIAVITSFFPEHLDYHGSIEAYLEAKQHIARFQGEDDMVFFCADSPGAATIALEGNGRKIPFSMEDAPVSIDQTHLIGAHNLSNIAGATKVTQELGVPEVVIVEAIKAFHGLPHRLQSIGIIGGIEWIDDAISTTPESTIAGLDALEDRVTTIILGGQDRGNDFTGLAKRLAESTVQNVILFPGSGPRIRTAIESTNATIRLFDASSMKEAVSIAKRETPLRPLQADFAGQANPQVLKTQNSKLKTPIVLLSTASPSYGMFKNFEEKGSEFQKWINA